MRTSPTHHEASAAAGPASRSPASPRSSRCGCAPCRWPTAPCDRSSRPTSSTSPAARRWPSPASSTPSRGEVLARHNKSDNFAVQQRLPGHGAARRRACGPKHAFELDGRPDPHDQRRRRRASRPTTSSSSSSRATRVLTTADTATNPEVATYAADVHPRRHLRGAGVRLRRRLVLVGQYALAVSTSDTAAPGTGDLTGNPQWRYFPANPTLDSADQVPTNSVVGCWTARRPAAPRRPTPLAQRRRRSARGTRSARLPTFTTDRQQRQHPRGLAQPADARRPRPGAVLPDPRVHRPSSPTAGTTAGATSPSCGPAATTSTPRSATSSSRTTGCTTTPTTSASPRRTTTCSSTTAAAAASAATRRSATPRPARITGGSPSFLGRDNANQITLQDGTPGITNQYLFEPIAGAFYAPCTDGGLDMGIVGHEYTHAISNRMVGGPDEGLTSEQGGAMGESWGDLVAGEYQFAHGYSNGGNVWAVGAYATGNTETAIRDYSIDQQPAELLRLRLRHHRPRGPRRRRDLERHDVGGPPGARREVRRPVPVRRQGRSSSPARRRLRRRRPRPAEHLPRQPPVGAADVRRLPAPAGRDVDARRPRRA